MPQMIALVGAAGRGLRCGTQKPRQYSCLAGIPLLRHSLLRLARHPAIEGIRVVIHPDDLADYEAATGDLPLLPPVEGGKSRQESVRRGLESLVSLQPGRVLIHDGARPFPSAALLDRLVSSLEEQPGAVPALPFFDTLKLAVS